MRVGNSRCQCSGFPYKGCGEYFNSTYAFDLHRIGMDRRCLSADEMLAAGMSKNSDGCWIGSKRSDSAIAQRRSNRCQRKADHV